MNPLESRDLANTVGAGGVWYSPLSEPLERRKGLKEEGEKCDCSEGYLQSSITLLGICCGAFVLQDQWNIDYRYAFSRQRHILRF